MVIFMVGDGNNRVLDDYRTWEENEKRTAVHLSAGIHSEAFLSAKYDFIQRTILRYGSTASQEEKVSIAALGAVGRQLHGIVRKRGLWGMLTDLLSARRRQVEVARDNSLRSRQVEELVDRLGAWGLGQLSPQIREGIAKGQREFSPEVNIAAENSGYVSYRVDFSAMNGNPEIRGILAQASSASGEGGARHYFSRTDIELWADSAKMANLLAGRAVLAPDGSWRQLDRNDADAEGNLKMKVFPVTDRTDLDIAGVLCSTGLVTPARARELQAELEVGGKVKLNAVIEGQRQELLVTAEPRSGSIRIMDGNGDVISPLSLKPETREIIREHQMRIAAKNGQEMEITEKKNLHVVR